MLSQLNLFYTNLWLSIKWFWSKRVPNALHLDPNISLSPKEVGKRLSNYYPEFSLGLESFKNFWFMFNKESRGRSFLKFTSVWSQSWMLPSVGRSNILNLVCLLCHTLDYSFSYFYKVSCSLYLSKHVIYFLWLFSTFLTMTMGSILSI